MKKKKNQQMDYNKLIKDIIRAAKKDSAVCGKDSETENARLITTLRLEVKVSKNNPQMIENAKQNSTKLVLLTIND